MMSFFTCVQKQLPGSDGNGETTFEKGKTNTLDVTFDYIAEDLLSFFNGVKSLHEAKKVIEKKYKIKKEHGDCWPADEIKQAWGQTQRMGIKSSKRRYWAHVIILQMLKRFMVYDMCKQNTAQEDQDDTTTDFNQACKTKPRMKENSEDTSPESNSASSTDVAPSPAELREKICYPHSHSNESRNAALANESKDTLDNCEQRKSIDKHEGLNFTDTPNRTKVESENGRWEDGLWSTDDINQACGKTESMKGNSEKRSTQSSDELKTAEAAGGDKQSSGANRKSSKSCLNQTDSVSQGRSRVRSAAGSQATKNDSGAANDRSGTNVSAASESDKAGDIICIRIPFSAMFSRRSPVSRPSARHQSRYKLINGFPSDADLRIRKSYAMSFDTETMNAKFVYEILNRNTLDINYERSRDIENDYVKGHLAAAANHRWCREAYNDANLFSNIIPQNRTLNNKIWKILENGCRNMVRDQEISNVHVYTGPLYLRRENGEDVRVLDTSRMVRSGVKVVPTHLFKVIIEEKRDGTVVVPKCYVFPNLAPQPNLNAEKNIEYIERVSGLRFIERRPNVNTRDYIKTVTLQGETGNGDPCTVDIGVRICNGGQ